MFFDVEVLHSEDKCDCRGGVVESNSLGVQLLVRQYEAGFTGDETFDVQIDGRVEEEVVVD